MSHRSRGGGLSAAEQRTLVREYLVALDCPRALSCWLLYSAGDGDSLVQLVNLVCDPMNYATVGDFRAAYAATKFLSKCDDLKTGIDKTGVAIEAAFQAELRCRTVNFQWKQLRLGTARSPLEPEIHRAKQKIAAILGEAPVLFGSPDSSEQAIYGPPFRDRGWSPGRTTACSGTQLSPYNKYRGRLDVTVSALRYARRELRDSPWWGAAALDADAPVSVLKEAFTVTEGNVMLTVPKNAKTDRVICYEPHMNIWLQLKVGSFIRERLKKFGVNLDDQSINQRRARLGSKTGHLATIDLRSASDTVSIELVEQLLPIDWVCLLHDLRSKYTLWPDDKWRKNHKFSSMGNGFTFELESLLFYAICSAVSTDVSVYGDDIVLPAENYERAAALLDHCGFEVNSSKSYSSGPFRESCGDDSYLGFSCTPVYLRSQPKTLEDVVKLHNQVLAFTKRGAWWPEWLPFGRVLWKWRKRFPHLLGPEGFGDGHYHVNLDEACPTRASHGVEGWWFYTVSRQYRKGVVSIDGCTARSLPAAICASVGPSRPRIYGGFASATTLDRRYFHYRKIRVLTSLWSETSWI